MAHVLASSAAKAATELSPGAIGNIAIIVSLLAQGIYLWRERRWADPVWRLGAAFSIMLLVLGPAVWAAPLAVTRAVLPMTLAFNILFYRKPPPNGWLFALGNVSVLFGIFKFFTYAS